MRRCLGCMQLFSENYQVCPHCGCVVGQEQMEAFHLKPGTMLKDRYLIGRALGYGGFGVTYRAWDTKLDREVAVKEYLPGEFCTRVPGTEELTVYEGDRREQYEAGRQKFAEEAERQVKLQNIPGIVDVYDTFEANHTAYIIMACLNGETLRAYLKKHQTIPAEDAVALMLPVLNALEKAHAIGLIHRDIAPDNIFLEPYQAEDDEEDLPEGTVRLSNGECWTVSLIDFGAARFATTKHSRSLSVILKPGYAPAEQYNSKSDQGPWTDVYAICATLYRMITGRIPEEAPDRSREDKMELPSKYASVPSNIENAIINGLNVRVEDRTPDVATLREELLADRVKRHWVKTKRSDVGKTPLWVKLAGGAGILAGVVLLVLASIWVWTEIIHPSYDKTLIPNLCGIEITQARSKAKSSGFEVTIGNKEYDDVQPKGYVLAQDQKAGGNGEEVKNIVVMISAGMESLYMPDVCGLSLDDAKAQLEEMGISVTTTEVESWTASGYIDAQNITEGTELHKGEEVILSVSKGQADLDTTQDSQIPNLIEHAYQEAKELAGASGFYIYQSNRIYSDTIPKGQIISQNPEAAESAKRGTAIAVTISLGQEMVHMPDVQYAQLEDARSQLEALGFVVETEEVDRGTEVAAGHIVSQNIEAGSECQKGARVVLQVNRPKDQENIVEEPSTYALTQAPTQAAAKPTSAAQPAQTPTQAPTQAAVQPTQTPTQAPTQAKKTWYRYRTRSEMAGTTARQDGRAEYRSAETQTIYGEWSGWSDNAIGGAADREVRTQVVNYQVPVTRYHYYYYTYINTSDGQRYYTYSASPYNATALEGPYRKTSDTPFTLYRNFSGYNGYRDPATGIPPIWFEGDDRGDSCAKTEYVTQQKTQWSWRSVSTITTYYYYSDWSGWSAWQEAPVQATSTTDVQTEVR